MGKLLLSDLKRIFKDKIFIIACIVGICFALLTPIILLVLTILIEFLNFQELSFLKESFYGRTIFFGSFNPGNNFGLILPILISIIVLKDFSYGTIRNKVITGYSRTQIFLSYFFAIFITLFALILTYALISLGLSLIFTPYQYEAFTYKDIIYFIVSLGFLLIAYLLIAAMLTFICVLIKNVALTIVVYIVASLAFSMLSTGLQVAIPVASGFGKEVIANILTFINNCNVYSSISTVIGVVNPYQFTDILYLIIPPLFGLALFITLGLVFMNKKDL